MAGNFSYSSNATDVANQLLKYLDYATEQAGEYERQFVIQLNARIMALTPVWEGEAMVNYEWSVGSPLLVYNFPRGGGVDPGHTNSMPLGPELRRPENEAAVRENLQAVLSANLPADIWLSNTSPGIIDLEYGLNPTPKTSRVSQSQGMVRLAVKQAMGMLRSN